MASRAAAPSLEEAHGPPKRDDPPTRDGQRKRAGVPPPPLAAPEHREATVHQAKTHLSRFLAEVEAGGTVVITRRGKPVAKLEAVSPKRDRVPGSMKGLISIDDRFFEPLPEDELRAWEGK